MSYEIRLSIEEESTSGHLIAALAASQQITPSQAVGLIVDRAAQQDSSTPLSPDHEETPMELVSRLRAQKAAKGEGPQPPLRTDNPERIIGLFADAPELVESILEVVDSRSQRYASRA